jgi:hypothetical protein
MSSRRALLCAHGRVWQGEMDEAEDRTCEECDEEDRTVHVSMAEWD